MTLCYFSVMPIIAFVAVLTYRIAKNHSDQHGKSYLNTLFLLFAFPFLVEFIGIFLLISSSLFLNVSMKPVFEETIFLEKNITSENFEIFKTETSFVLNDANGKSFEISNETEIVFEETNIPRFELLRPTTNSKFNTFMKGSEIQTIGEKKKNRLVLPRNSQIVKVKKIYVKEYFFDKIIK